MATLKHAGIVRTTLGAHGGYAIAADPSTVSLGRVVRLLDGALAPLGCVSLRYYEPCSCPDEATCALRDTMIDVRDAILEILDNETLAELAARRGVRRSTRPGATPTRWPGRGPGTPSLVPHEAPQRGLDPLLERARRPPGRRARSATPRAPRPASSRAPGARPRSRPRWRRRRPPPIPTTATRRPR